MRNAIFNVWCNTKAVINLVRCVRFRISKELYSLILGSFRSNRTLQLEVCDQCIQRLSKGRLKGDQIHFLCPLPLWAYCDLKLFRNPHWHVESKLSKYLDSWLLHQFYVYHDMLCFVLLHGCFSHFLNCTKSTKSRSASHTCNLRCHSFYSFWGRV